MKLPLWPICAALVVLWDVLFYRHPLGCNLGLYVAAAGFALLARAPRRGVAPAVLFGLTLLPAAILVHHGSLLAALLAAGLLVLLALTARLGWTADPAAWLRRVARLAGFGWMAPFRDLALGARARRRRRPAGAAGSPWGRRLARWLVPAGLGAVFLVLFVIANPVFEEGALRSLSAIQRILDLDWFPDALRVLAWALTAAALWALFRVRRHRERPAETPPSIPGVDTASPEFIGRCLLVFNLVFAAQNVSDLVFLWGGAALPKGMTYAQYAHRGAYPLVATALLAALFMLVVFRPRGTASTHRLVRGLMAAWIAQNLVLLASAAWRLHLYVDVYSLTRLRLAAAVWMGLVAFGLAAICARILAGRSNRWLVQVNAVALFLVLLACAAASADRIVAWHNVRHCREAGGEGPAFDVRYAQQLGPEVLPALAWLEARPDVPWELRARLRGLWSARAEEVREALADWRGWTVRRGQLSRLAPPPGLAAPSVPSTP